LRAVARSNRVPRTLRGDHEAVALGNVQDFNISDHDRLAILQNMYSLTPDAQLRHTGKDAFDAMKMLQFMDKELPMKPEPLAAFVPGAVGPMRVWKRRSLNSTGGIIIRMRMGSFPVCSISFLMPSRRSARTLATAWRM